MGQDVIAGNAGGMVDNARVEQTCHQTAYNAPNFNAPGWQGQHGRGRDLGALWGQMGQVCQRRRLTLLVALINRYRIIPLALG